MSRNRRWRSLAVVAALVLGGPAVMGPAQAATGDTAWTSGLNSDGQLGNGTTANRAGFGVVPGLADVDDVHGGREHAIALSGGQVWSWGDGSKGALGRGS